MAALLTAQTSNSNPASATGTATATATTQLIEVPDDSVFAGAQVIIQVSSANTATKFASFGREFNITQPTSFTIEVPIGHFVRALLEKAGTTTSVSVNMLAVT